jgi:poly [ADP-ribose] polymerase 6/8
MTCVLPEGEYYAVVYKNKSDKKERNESKTQTSKKLSNPVWEHSVEMTALPTDELIFEVYRSKKLYASVNLVVGLIDNGQNTDLRMTYKDPTAVKPDAKPCVMTIWAALTKPGSSTAKPDVAAASSSAAPGASPVSPVVKRDSLRTARAGPQGSSGRAVKTANDETTVGTSPPSSSASVTKSEAKADKSDKSSRRKSEKDKKKRVEVVATEVEEEEPKIDSDEDLADNEFKEPPRRKKTKAKVVPDDEDPEDFWNGTSKSKTKEKKKEIKKLQQSLESMTINLKSSWREGSSANQQQRFAVMINDIGCVNTRPDACASQTRSQSTGLTVRLAFAIDLPSDRASGCGIDTEKWMFLEMVFPKGTYLEEEPKAASKTLTVRQCTAVASGDELAALGTQSIHSFGLWWTIEQRLSAHFFKEWASIEEGANKAAKKASKGDGKGVSIADAWAILEILEWPASQLPLASAALLASKNDVKQALELILDDEWLATTKSTLKLDKDKSSEVEGGSAPAPPKKGTESGFLENLIDIVTTMIKEAGKYCPICGDPHPLELFKPIVCGNDLCKFQFSNMGLGVDFETELIHSPMAVDLLITMTDHAVCGNHFDPFPHEVSAKVDGITHSLKQAMDVGNVLRVCPSVDEMVDLAKAGKLRPYLNGLHPLLYPLLRWIVTSSRAHLHFLPEDDRVPQCTTPYQFHLKSTPPEKEQYFYAAKKKYGSFYAWHGSATANWHSILRNGLKNYSNSKYQANGAAYGPGVYMAVDSGTSIGYSWRSGAANWTKSRYSGGQDLIILALCEVINEGESLCTGNVHRPHCYHSHSAPYYRIEKDDYITTRYLFVVNSGSFSVTAASIQSHLKTKQLLRSNKNAKKPEKKKPAE